MKPLQWQKVQRKDSYSDPQKILILIAYTSAFLERHPGSFLELSVKGKESKEENLQEKEKEDLC